MTVHATQNKLVQMTELNKILTDAMYEILDSNRLDIAKEVAADAIGEDLEEYLSESRSELNFHDNEFDGELDYSLLEED